MMLHPRRTISRALATVLVLLQVAFCTLGALPHPGETANKVATISAPGAPAGVVLHDELRCPLCQFAAQQAQPVPVCNVVLCVLVPEAPLAIVNTSHAVLPPHFTPSWRAPPADLS